MIYSRRALRPACRRTSSAFSPFLTYIAQPRPLGLEGTETASVHFRREISLGATEIETLPDDTFRIGSFFDLNLELTLDEGQTWIPSSVTGRVAVEEP